MIVLKTGFGGKGLNGGKSAGQIWLVLILVSCPTLPSLCLMTKWVPFYWGVVVKVLYLQCLCELIDEEVN